MLELLRIDVETGKMSIVLTWDTFAAIRQLVPFRLTGGSKGSSSSPIHLVRMNANTLF